MRHAEAEQQYKEALRVVGGAQGVDHPKIAAIRLNLGGALMAQQRLAEAEVEFREALEIRLARLPPEHPEIAGARNNLALALERLGRIEDAEGELRAAVIALGRTRPPDHPDVLGSQGNLAAFLRRNERGHAESLELLETIWSVRRAGAGTDGLRARAAFELAQALGSAGVQPERAIELAERARDLLTATKTTDAAEHAPAVAEIDQWLRARRSGQPRRSP